MCLTTLHTLSVLWPLTVLVAVLLLRQILILVGACIWISYNFYDCAFTSTAGCTVPVGPGTSLTLSCSPGYVPSEVMSSTCQSDGSLEPDTAQLECPAGTNKTIYNQIMSERIYDSLVNTTDCGPPAPAANVVLEPPAPNTTVGSTFSFRCAEALFPNTTHEAVCGADGQWRPDPANHNCVNGSAGLY